MYITFL